MILATSATSAAAIDPTMLALLSIFGGVIITVLAGFIGAWLQAKRDRTKWIRERRLEAYADHLTVTDELFATGLIANLDEEPEIALVAEARRAIATLHLLGPDDVYDAAVAFQEAMSTSLAHDGAVDELEGVRLRRRSRYINGARAALR
ncbi:hypothetical protein [Salinibacterium sp. ZJ450]|uniref:hypothetical protein n=1 Tax=Salinibacterium sp. ZJ450 TaxID=2708338 RepID=UPI00142282E8|nr:hypothetical protein [Salinibacterium sp. ZJ450]